VARTVLIVEDNPEHLKLAAVLLERAGFDVLRADTAEAGLRLAQQGQPDVILMDVRLPGMDGLAATRELKNDERTRAIPVVMISSFTTEVVVADVYAAGALGLITKPFHYSEFLRAIRKVLGESENG